MSMADDEMRCQKGKERKREKKKERLEGCQTPTRQNIMKTKQRNGGNKTAGVEDKGRREQTVEGENRTREQNEEVERKRRRIQGEEREQREERKDDALKTKGRQKKIEGIKGKKKHAVGSSHNTWERKQE